MTGDWKNEGIRPDAGRINEQVFMNHESHPCLTIALGLISYADAYQLQRRLVAARKLDAIEDVLLLCEHPHVITQGRNGKREHLLASEHVLHQKGVEYFETSRGGDVTYHGPGQLVGYPILNLAAIRRDVGWYVRMLEEVMIRASGDFGIAAERYSGKTGVWVVPEARPHRSATVAAADFGGPLVMGLPEKVGAIGVHISRWVTSHGFAYNVSTDLRYFDLIVPCGIPGRKATTLEKLLGRSVDANEVRARIVGHFGEVFGLQMQPMRHDELLQKLHECEEALAVSA